MIELEQDILIYALRYALGRQTYAVNDVIMAISTNWKNLSDNVKLIIREDIRKHLLNLNQDFDTCYNDWKNLYKELNNA